MAKKKKEKVETLYIVYDLQSPILQTQAVRQNEHWYKSVGTRSETLIYAREAFHTLKDAQDAYDALRLKAIIGLTHVIEEATTAITRHLKDIKKPYDVVIVED